MIDQPARRYLSFWFSIRSGKSTIIVFRGSGHPLKLSLKSLIMYTFYGEPLKPVSKLSLFAEYNLFVSMFGHYPWQSVSEELQFLLLLHKSRYLSQLITECHCISGEVLIKKSLLRFRFQDHGIQCSI